MTKATYDSRGRVLTTKGPRTDVNETTTYKYYSDTDSDIKRRGQVDTVTDALNHTTTFGSTGSYDWFGNALSVQDANGVLVEGTFDSLGRQTSNTVEATGSFAATKTSIVYDKLGQPKTVTLPNGNGSTYHRDTTERLTARIATDSSSLQHEQLSLAYDTMSEPTTVLKQGCTTPAASCASWVTGNSNEFAFDSHARLSQILYGPSASVTDETLMTYNDPPSGAPGTLASIVTGKVSDLNAGNSGVLGHQYNYSNTRLPATDYYLNYGSSSSGFGYSWTESFNYDVLNNLASIVPYNGPSTNFTYDDWNRRTSMGSSVYGSISDTYDASGNLTKEVDSDGNVTSYTYDALERRLTASATRSGSPTETVTWTYDDPTAADLGIGRLWKVTDPSGSRAYTYEPHGNVASDSQAITGKTTYKTSYTYDGNGNILTMTYPSGRVVTYTYDFLDRPLTAKSSSTTYVSAATYAPMGPRTSTTYGNGMVENFILDKNYLVSELTVTGASGSKLVDRGYLRDGQHRITSITDNLAAGYDLAYSFSNFGISAANSGASLWGTEAIVTDAYWFNVLSQQFSSYHGAAYTLGLNQGSNPWQPTQSGANNNNLPIVYDANGNITTFNNATYAYSSRDLISSGEGISYAYNGSNQRVLATGSTGSRAYIYDSAQKLVAESAAGNSSTGYEYIYLNGQPVAQEDIGGTTHWTAQDHIGTPFLQTNSADTAYWFADYEPFGAVYALRTSDAHQPLRRPGQEATEITGTSGPNGDSQLFYNGARWYLAHFGRYLEPDPTGLTNSIENPYAYTFVDPVDENDADGEKVFFATHQAFADPISGISWGHAYIVLRPDDLNAFKNDRRFHVNGTCSSSDPMNTDATISGEQVFQYDAGILPDSRLESVPNADEHSDRNNLQEIKPPAGLSDTQFINELLNTDDLYGATNGVIAYGPGAGTSLEAANAYNSNSFAHSILNAVGAKINIPQLIQPTMMGLGLGSYSGYLPGWNKILDLERGSTANRFNCELASKGSWPAQSSVGSPVAAVTIVDGGGDDGGFSGIATGNF